MASIFKRFTASYGPAQVPNLVGRTYVVTGGSDGIGLSLSRTLYSHGAHLHIISRDKQTADEALAYIKSGDLAAAPETYRAGFGSQADTSAEGGDKSGDVQWHQVDFSDLNQVAQESQKLAENLDRLDGAFLVAGLGVNEFKLTKDGYE